MRSVLFFRIYALPVLLALFLIIELVTGSTPFKLFVHITFLVAVLLAILLDDKKYIQQFSIVEGRMEILFLTQFLTRRSIGLETAGIRDLKFERQGLFGLWPGGLKIKYKDDWLNFQVLNRKRMKEIQGQIESAGVGTPRMGLC